MPDTTTDSDSNKIQKLEKELEKLKAKQSGKNQIQMEAYDLSIRVQSEDCSMQEMMQMCSEEMDDMMQQALIGEFQELESRDLFSELFDRRGGD